jgi:hypothetical protein
LVVLDVFARDTAVRLVAPLDVFAKASHSQLVRTFQSNVRMCTYKNILGIIFCSLYLHKCKQVSLRQRTNNIDMKIAQLDGSTSASKLRRMMMMMMITAGSAWLCGKTR